MIISMNLLFHKKLFMKGIGYKFILKHRENNILQLVLGLSHSVFIKLPKEINLFLIKPTLLYLTCIDYLKLNSITQLIKNLKIPEVYKGKGINYEYNSIILKEGKKPQ